MQGTTRLIIGRLDGLALARLCLPLSNVNRPAPGLFAIRLRNWLVRCKFTRVVKRMNARPLKPWQLRKRACRHLRQLSCYGVRQGFEREWITSPICIAVLDRPSAGALLGYSRQRNNPARSSRRAVPPSRCGSPPAARPTVTMGDYHMTFGGSAKAAASRPSEETHRAAYAERLLSCPRTARPDSSMHMCRRPAHGADLCASSAMGMTATASRDTAA